MYIDFLSLQDAHGNQFGQTVKDKSQDYQLIVGYQYQDNTVLRFKRKLNTCDGEDLAITVSHCKDSVWNCISYISLWLFLSANTKIWLDVGVVLYIYRWYIGCRRLYDCELCNNLGASRVLVGYVQMAAIEYHSCKA